MRSQPSESQRTKTRRTNMASVKVDGSDFRNGSQDEEKNASQVEGAVSQYELGGPLEKALVRKMDFHLVPLIMLLYTFSFLDRVNIGNARLYSMEKDLGLVGNQYQTAVSLVFVTYVMCETPSNMVLKKFTPRIWIALITFTWGLIATLTGLVNTYGQLLACRLLLGAVEAGLFPGLTVYLTFFYTKKELGMRVGYLLVSAAVAGALGGLLAFGIGSMDGLQGMHGWRWIMIIEGIPSCVLGIVTYFLLPNDADHAYFLNDADKALIQARRDAEYGQTASAQLFSMKDAKTAFKDWKVWLMSTGQFGIDVMLYGFSAFLPTIINGLGHWTSAQVQLLTIPCYVMGIVSYLTIAYMSDRHQMRAVYVISMACVSIVGYGILISDSSAGVHYFG